MEFLKSFSDAILSKQPSPKNFLQILLCFFTNLDECGRDWPKYVIKCVHSVSNPRASSAWFLLPRRRLVKLTRSFSSDFFSNVRWTNLRLQSPVNLIVFLNWWYIVGFTNVVLYAINCLIWYCFFSQIYFCDILFNRVGLFLFENF